MKKKVKRKAKKVKRKAKKKAVKLVIPKGYMLVPVKSLKTLKKSVLAIVKAFKAFSPTRKRR